MLMLSAATIAATQVQQLLWIKYYTVACTLDQHIEASTYNRLRLLSARQWEWKPKCRLPFPGHMLLANIHMHSKSLVDNAYHPCSFSAPMKGFAGELCMSIMLIEGGGRPGNASTSWAMQAQYINIAVRRRVSSLVHLAADIRQQ